MIPKKYIVYSEKILIYSRITIQNVSATTVELIKSMENNFYRLKILNVKEDLDKT